MSEPEVEAPVEEPLEEPAAEPEPEEEEELEPEPVEPEPTEAQGLNEYELKKRDQSLDKENTRHANRISEILGEEAQGLLPCPLCDPAGFVYAGSIGTQPDEIRQAVHMVLGEIAPPVYREVEWAEMCRACGGQGRVKTGSQVQRQETATCRACKGVGWIDLNPGMAPREPTIVQPNGGGEPGEMAGNDVDVDLWGRLKGDPDFGVHPLYVTAR